MNSKVIKTIVILLITFFIVPLHVMALDDENESSTEIKTIEFKATPMENSVISLNWDNIEDADYYILYKYDDLDNILETVEVSKTNTYKFTNLTSGFTYRFSVEAYQKLLDESVLIAKSLPDTVGTKAVKALFNENDFRSLKGFTITKPLKLASLRKRLNEPYNGYSVVQGGCSDGVYTYQLLISKSNDKGRVLKIRISDKKTIAKSNVLNINHGNGMACDTTNNRLVIVGNKANKTVLKLVDMNTLLLKGTTSVDYSNSNNSNGWKIKKKSGYYGLLAISYIEKYDLYIGLQRSTYDLLVLNRDFKVVGFIDTKFSSSYDGNYQGIDSDEKYVYLLLSPYSNKQPNNIILAVDWNSETVLDLVNNYNSSSFIKDAWTCHNLETGLPDAVIKVSGLYEAENIFHTKGSDSKNHFYVSEYKNRAMYHWVNYKVPYKAKWKKVKKKVKYKKVSKYKKVKVKVIKNGKVKYKKLWKKVKVWKYKKKKVWVYKTKYKNKKVYEFHYYKRNGYIYDIGTF